MSSAPGTVRTNEAAPAGYHRHAMWTRHSARFAAHMHELWPIRLSHLFSVHTLSRFCGCGEHSRPSLIVLVIHLHHHHQNITRRLRLNKLMMLEHVQVLQALEAIIDPDFGMSIVECGFVKDLDVNAATGGLPQLLLFRHVTRLLCSLVPLGAHSDC